MNTNSGVPITFLQEEKFFSIRLSSSQRDIKLAVEHATGVELRELTPAMAW